MIRRLLSDWRAALVGCILLLVVVAASGCSNLMHPGASSVKPGWYNLTLYSDVVGEQQTYCVQALDKSQFPIGESGPKPPSHADYFPFGQLTNEGFWMKDTRGLLYIVWLNGATVVGTDHMLPMTLTVHKPPADYTAALEIPGMQSPEFTPATAALGAKCAPPAGS